MKHKDFQGCGTYGGYQQHKLTKEKSCEPCLLAMREYKKTNYYKNYDKNIKRLKKYKASDKAKETLRIYVQKNADAFRVRNTEKERRRRANKVNAGIEFYTEEQVLNLYGTNCGICNKPIDLTASRRVGRGNWQLGLHIDHKIALIKGGSDTLDNVQPAHALCNLNKGGK